jgi:hypothetical protein
LIGINVGKKPDASILRAEDGRQKVGVYLQNTQLYIPEDCNLDFISHIDHKSFVHLTATVRSPQYNSL